MEAASGNRFPIVLCGLLLGLAAVRTCEGVPFWFPFVKHHVEIRNGLTGENFQVHCRSRDDDLGVHDLAPGEAYRWGFRNNWRSTTLYWCNMDSRQYGHSSFVVYSANKFDLTFEACKDTCIWLATEYGFSIFGKRGTWESMYSWGTTNAIGT